MSTLAKLLVALGINTSEYNAGLDAAEKKAGTSSSNIGKSMSEIGGKISGAGQKLSLFATAPIMAGFAMSINAASDMNETVSKSNVVFGGQAEAVQKFASSAATNIGLTSQKALEAAGTYGNLFVSMGIGTESAADMSMGLVGLAGDLASFNNLDPTEVLDKLRSGMVGETEPLRALGVNINEAMVKAKAMEMGLMKAGDTMTPQIATTARYALILAQTKTAQGDFARTSDGLANSSRIAKAQLGDLAITAGQHLLPIALKLAQGISTVISWFTNLSPSTQKVIIIILAVVAAIGPLLMIVGSMISAIGAIIPVVTAVAGVLTFPLIAIIAAVIAVVALLALAWKNDWGGIREKFATVKDFLVRAFETVSEWLKTKIPAAIKIVKGWINDHLIKPFNDVKDAISGVIDWIGNLIDKFTSIKLPDWLTPGSPTPFELGIRGIGDAMEDLSNKKIPAFQTGLLLSPALAGAGGSGGNLYSTMTINAAPGQSEDAIARRVIARLEGARRYAKAGGGYAGG